MRYAIFSDIHSNIEAFEEVLLDIDRAKVDRHLFLGDIVGYGPNPNECMELLLKVADLTLGGNHDWAVVGLTSDEYFNPFAKAAADWTGMTLKDSMKDFLKRTRPMDTYDGFQVAHASPKDPELWNYILSYRDATENYDYLEQDICFVGHSHQPLIIEYESSSEFDATRDTYKALDPDRKYIINVGSVGQPRDANPDACWVLFDAEEGTVEYRRVPYDIPAVQKKMREAGLPKYLVERLAKGR